MTTRCSGKKRTGRSRSCRWQYSDYWHVVHLNNPRDVVPESVMPSYTWLLKNRLKTDS